MSARSRRCANTANVPAAKSKVPEVKLGIMVEIPAVAVMADRFAPLVDFFSIGTNDLTQYTLAVDRQHPELAAQADSLHPAVLALIDATVRGAQAASRSAPRPGLGRGLQRFRRRSAGCPHS